MFEDQVTYLYIGAGNVDTLANGTKVSSASDITAGALVVLDSENKAVKGSLATGKVRIAQRIGNQIVYSPFFDMSKLTNKVHEDYAASTEQVSYLGYNGTDGELDESANTLYSLQFVLKNTMATFNNSPMIRTVPYKTVGATQAELALGLIQSANSVFSKRTIPYPLIKFERIFNEAVTAANAVDNNVTIVKGTKSFVVATAATYNTGTAIAVGDYVRIGTVGGGTALTSPVYKVTAVNSLTITVDDYIQSTSGTYATATDDVEIIPAANVDGDTAFGIKMTGLAPTSTFNPIVDRYEKVQFEVTSDDFTTMTFRTTTQATEGTGTYEQVATQEVYCAMNEGQGRFLSMYPPTNYRSEAASTTTYDIISFEAYDDTFSDIVGNKPKSKQRIVLAMYHGSTQYTSLKTVLGTSAA